MKTITMDGDLYRLDMPVMDEVVALLDHNRLALSNSIFASDFDEGYLSVYRFQADSRVSEYIGKKEPGNPFQNRANRFLGFLPCLVPLDKSGSEVGFQFWQDNPQFSRLHGGSVYVNGKVYDFKNRPYSNMFDRGIFSLGSSSDNPENILSWVVYNHKLYCTTIIAYMDIAHVIQLLGLDEE